LEVKKKAQIYSIVEFSKKIKSVLENYKKNYKENIDEDFSELYNSFDSDNVQDKNQKTNLNNPNKIDNVSLKNSLMLKNEQSITFDEMNFKSRKHHIDTNLHHCELNKSENFDDNKKHKNSNYKKLINIQDKIEDAYEPSEDRRNSKILLEKNLENFVKSAIDFDNIFENNLLFQEDKNLIEDLLNDEDIDLNNISSKKENFFIKSQIQDEVIINEKTKQFNFEKFKNSQDYSNDSKKRRQKKKGNRANSHNDFEKLYSKNLKAKNQLKEEFKNKNIFFNKNKNILIINKNIFKNHIAQKRYPSNTKVNHLNQSLKNDKSMHQNPIQKNSFFSKIRYDQTEESSLSKDENFYIFPIKNNDDIMNTLGDKNNILKNNIKFNQNSLKNKDLKIQLNSNYLENYKTSSSCYYKNFTTSNSVNINKSNKELVNSNMLTNNYSNFLNFPITKKECSDLLEQIKLIDFNMKNLNIILKRVQKNPDKWDFAYKELKKRVKYKEILENKDFPWELVKVRNFNTEKIKKLYKDLLNNPLSYNSLILKKSFLKTFGRKKKQIALYTPAISNLSNTDSDIYDPIIDSNLEENHFNKYSSEKKKVVKTEQNQQIKKNFNNAVIDRKGESKFITLCFFSISITIIFEIYLIYLNYKL